MAALPRPIRTPLYLLSRLFFVFLVIMVAGLAAVGGETLTPQPEVADRAQHLIIASVLVGGLWLLRSRVDHKPWEGIGLTPFRARAFGLGLALGLAVLGVAIIVELALGYLHPVAPRWTFDGWTTALVGLALAAPAYVAVGIAEETLCRGYLLQTFGERMPLWAAALLSGAIFGALHVVNGGFGIGFFLSALVISLTFTTLRLATGSLWAPIGMHATWDFAQDGLTNLMTVNNPVRDWGLIRFRQTGPELIVGPAPSIEGGLLLGGLIFAVLLALLWITRGSAGMWRAPLREDGRPSVAAPQG